MAQATLASLQKPHTLIAHVADQPGTIGGIPSQPRRSAPNWGGEPGYRSSTGFEIPSPGTRPAPSGGSRSGTGYLATITPCSTGTGSSAHRSSRTGRPTRECPEVLACGRATEHNDACSDFITRGVRKGIGAAEKS